MNSNVKSLVWGTFVSSVGDNLYHIAIMLLAYGQTNAIASLGYLWLVRALFRLPSQILAGYLTDHYNRKHIIVTSNLLSALVCLLFVYNPSNMPVLLLGVGLLQGLNDFDVNSAQAMLPELVEKKVIKEVNGIFARNQSVGVFIAPAITTIIYKTLGLHWVFILNALSFLGASLCFMTINYRRSSVLSQKREKFYESFFTGYKIIRSKVKVFRMIVLFLAFGGLVRLFTIYRLPIIDQGYNLGESGIIMFNYIDALAGLLMAWVIKKNLIKWSFSMVTLVITGIMILFPVFHLPMMAIVLYFAYCILSVVQSIAFRTTLQEEVDNEYLGRVFSTFRVFVMMVTIPVVICAPYLSTWGMFIPMFIYGLLFICPAVVYLEKRKNSL